MILISVAPRVPKQGRVPGAVWKQLMSSDTSSISATNAKLCSSSSMLSSLIVKNLGTLNVLLEAGIITSMEETLKSGPGGSEIEREYFLPDFKVNSLLLHCWSKKGVCISYHIPRRYVACL